MKNAVGHTLMILGLSLGLICTLMPMQAQAADPVSTQTHGWSFELMPVYLWFPSVEGDLIVRNQTDQLDISVPDFISLMVYDLRFALTGRLVARRNRLLFTFDLISLSVEQDEFLGGVNERESKFTQIVAEAGVGYQIGTWTLGESGSPVLATDLVVGARYEYIDAEVEIMNPLFSFGISQDVDWFEPFIGAHLYLILSKQLNFFLGGNVGGFGVGSDLTWTITGGIQFHIWRSVHMFAGYRVLDIDYDEGSGNNRFEYDIQMKGPGFGFVFKF